jgi:hypothetical protein
MSNKSVKKTNRSKNGNLPSDEVAVVDGGTIDDDGVVLNVPVDNVGDDNGERFDDADKSNADGGSPSASSTESAADAASDKKSRKEKKKQKKAAGETTADEAKP